MCVNYAGNDAHTLVEQQQGEAVGLGQDEAMLMGPPLSHPVGIERGVVVHSLWLVEDGIGVERVAERVEYGKAVRVGVAEM